MWKISIIFFSLFFSPCVLAKISDKESRTNGVAANTAEIASNEVIAKKEKDDIKDDLYGDTNWHEVMYRTYIGNIESFEPSVLLKPREFNSLDLDKDKESKGWSAAIFIRNIINPFPGSTAKDHLSRSKANNNTSIQKLTEAWVSQASLEVAKYSFHEMLRLRLQPKDKNGKISGPSIMKIMEEESNRRFTNDEWYNKIYKTSDDHKGIVDMLRELSRQEAFRAWREHKMYLQAERQEALQAVTLAHLVRTQTVFSEQLAKFTQKKASSSDLDGLLNFGASGVGLSEAMPSDKKIRIEEIKGRVEAIRKKIILNKKLNPDSLIGPENVISNVLDAVGDMQDVLSEELKPREVEIDSESESEPESEVE